MKDGSKIRRSFIRLMQLLAVAYLVILLVVLIFQRRLIYFPTKISPDAIVSAAAKHGFVPWKNSTGDIIGWKIAAKTGAAASVLVVHGNAGCAIDRDYLAQPIHDAADADVFVLEYPGYGARSGSPSRESFIAAAKEAFQLLATNTPRYVVSESIGAGVAADLAKSYPSEVAGMMMFVPYHDLAFVAQRKMPFLPAGLMLRDRFSPAEDMKHYQGPVKFLVAGSDEVIPPASGRKLCDGYSGPKKMQEIPGAGHNDVAEQSAAWWSNVFLFWQRNAHELLKVGNESQKK